MKEQRYRELFEYDLDGIISLGLEGQIITASESCRNLLGYSVDELLGTAFEHLVDPQDLLRASEALHVATGGESQSVEAIVIHKDGNRVKLHLMIVPITMEEKIVGISMIVRDVTERRRLEEQLLHEALHDPLTDLLNRRLFGDRLEHALARLDRTEGSVVLLLLDLDNFKLMNDGFGHAVGDEVLRLIGERLRSSLRPADTAARLGGDEFAILVENNPLTNNAVRMAKRILEKLREPLIVQGRELSITASVGIALATTAHRYRPEDLLREADLAMYRAKSRGKNRCATSDPAGS